MVMEYLEGCDASQLLRDAGPLPVADAVELVIQACHAIAEAHALGIVHRDLKPANLFVTRHSDGSPLVKVLDFGISKMIEEGVDALTRSATTFGSALYMSPEQMKQSRSVDHRTDVYALGITLYEFLTGRHPFIAETYAALCVEVATGTPTPLRELRAEVPEGLARVLEQAYARDREQRFPSIAAFMLALSPFAPESVKPLIERTARAAGLLERGANIAIPSASGTTSGAPTGAQFASATTNRGTGTKDSRSALPGFLLGGAVLGVVLLVGVGLLLRAKPAGPVPETAPASAPAVELALPSAEPSAQPVVEPDPPPAPSASASAQPAKVDPKPPVAARRAPGAKAPPSKAPETKEAAPKPPEDPYSVR
jgi:serine/threonine-protein kinase